MMNTWALPPRFQARSEAINPEFWSGIWIPGPVAFCSRACPPGVCASDGQPLKIQSGLSGEAL
jgi:hypothetical protein